MMAAALEESLSRSSDDSKTETAQNSLDYVQMSKEGIRLLLNNDWQGALEFFIHHKCV